MKMNKLKTFILMALCSLLIFTSCNQVPETGGNNGEVEFWSTYSTQKIMKDQYEYYNGVRLAPKIQLDAATNEYESAQLIMTATSDVGAYSVELADLKLQSDATKIFSKENVTVYNQKYIEITTITNSTDVPVGWYPDALLPLSSAIEYGENTIKEGENQGLWFTFFVPEGTAPGTYTGSFLITVDGKSTSIPVSLTVFDYMVSEETHSKSIFMNQWQFYYGELDSTEAMYDKYTEALKEYRLSVWELTRGFDGSQKDIEEFVDAAYEYAKDPGVGNYSVRYKLDAVPDGNGGTVECFNPDVLVETLVALAEKSFETNYNMFEKATFHSNTIDEPDQFQVTGDRVPFTMELYKKCLEDAARIVRQGSYDHSLQETVAQGIENLHFVVTSAYTGKFVDYIDTWCPQAQYYNTEALRSRYADQEEKWWYTCTGPKNPYPTYHIEESYLDSARVASWMMSEYDIVGNLYWATDYYVLERSGNRYPLEDYYQTANRVISANGDGFLFYPGKRYGIDGPVASMRLHAIRDGNEEYEIMYDLRNSYENAGFDADDILKYISEDLYEGSRYIGDPEKYAEARTQLLSIAALLKNGGVMLTDIEETENSVTITAAADRDAVLMSEGKRLEPNRTEGDKSIYEIVTMLDEAQNYFELTSGDVSFRIYLGGKAVKYAAESLLPAFSSTNEGADFKLEEGKIVASLPAVDENTTHLVSMEGALVSAIGENSSKLKIAINSPVEIDYEICFEYENSALYYSMSTGILNAGENSIEIRNLGAIDWNARGKIKKIHFFIGKQGDAAITISFGDMVLFDS